MSDTAAFLWGAFTAVVWIGVFLLLLWNLALL